MNTKSFLCIANWKSYFTHSQGRDWLSTHATELHAYKDTLIICPDFTLLAHASSVLPAAMCGAQDCSAYTAGAHTGDVTADSLASCNVAFCIVGHWERVVYYGESPESSAQKINLLLRNKITPLLCVQDTYKSVLPFIYEQIAGEPGDLLIAYEPPSAIGTGKTPLPEDIEKTIRDIRLLSASLDNQRAVRVLYGGSVNGSNAAQLKKLDGLDGLLIGKASTDFQELKKIVEC